MLQTRATDTINSDGHWYKKVKKDKQIDTTISCTRRFGLSGEGSKVGYHTINKYVTAKGYVGYLGNDISKFTYRLERTGSQILTSFSFSPQLLSVSLWQGTKKICQ